MDLISRQHAIQEIEKFVGYLDEDMVYRIKLALKRLPSAEPNADKCWGCNCPKMRGEEE